MHRNISNKSYSFFLLFFSLHVNDNHMAKECVSESMILKPSFTLALALKYNNTTTNTKNKANTYKCMQIFSCFEGMSICLWHK